MMIISFRSTSEKEDMLHKAKQMERYAAEFVDCLERSESEYDGEYDAREQQRTDMSYRNTPQARDGRYMYKQGMR